ncbi:alkyl sulfatase dimerization domain-containing protein [Streptomyces sp. NPDC056352]|uniref:alkyl sulfatase dimerization domain-containing protein n=1 Tax=Streptomyces sp. NPDC056352 TaxID=3345791 RepID=UPI0035E19445
MNPSHLLPSSQDAQAAEVARLAGGVATLVGRARTLAGTDLRLACHVAEWAFLADRSDKAAQACYREVLEARAQVEPSLMAQAQFSMNRRRQYPQALNGVASMR